MEALGRDYRKAPISEQDRVMPDCVVNDDKKTRPDVRACLHAVGFEDQGILQITPWFNSINHLVEALGIGREG